MENKNGSECQDFVKCMQYLDLILDNEATKEQEEFVARHIDKCTPCFQQYELETHIRELLKTKVERRKVPANLAAEIRVKIQSIPR